MRQRLGDFRLLDRRRYGCFRHGRRHRSPLRRILDYFRYGSLFAGWLDRFELYVFQDFRGGYCIRFDWHREDGFFQGAVSFGRRGEAGLLLGNLSFGSDGEGDDHEGELRLVGSAAGVKQSSS